MVVSISGKYTRIRDRDIIAGEGESDDKAKDSNSWESVIVHVGKYKGKALGEVDETGVATLIDKWLPKAVADKKAEDKALIDALTDLSALINGDEY